MSNYEQSKRDEALTFLASTVRCSTNEEIRIQAAAAILAGTKPGSTQQTERDPVAAFLLLLRSAETIADQRISVRRRDDGQWIAITDDEVFESLSQDPTHALTDLLMTIASYREACV